MADERKDLDHGKTRTYQLFGCRCKECKAAQSKYQREYRASANGSRRWRIQRVVDARLKSACLEWMREHDPNKLETMRSEIRLTVEGEMNVD